MEKNWFEPAVNAERSQPWKGLMNQEQLKLFLQADWNKIRTDLIIYTEKVVRSKYWKTGEGLPKGFEAADIALQVISKTLNGIAGDLKHEIGYKIWNQEKNHTLLDHLKDGVDADLYNLVESNEHKKTNYSGNVSQEEAQTIFENNLSESGVFVESSEDRLIGAVENDHRHQEAKKIIEQVCSDLDGRDDEAVLILMSYIELSEKFEDIKPAMIAEELGMDISDVYNALKRIRRAFDKYAPHGKNKYERK